VGAIDRIAPTRRPDRRNDGTQRWRDLLFLHWEVAADPLRRLIPEGLELDLFDGRAFVGLVAFAMEGVRPRWWPEALAFRFLETNVRAYVTVGDRPGVYFFSLDAASRLAVWAARATFSLPYHFATMAMEKKDGTEVLYTTVRRSSPGAALRVRYEIGDEIAGPAPGTLEHFLVERYLLFVERRGRIFTGQVHHAPYPVRRARVSEVEEGLLAAAGIARPGGAPLAHFSPGVDVEVFGLRTGG
jgi:uncharacterized protein YqjF (DUF2071 family)